MTRDAREPITWAERNNAEVRKLLAEIRRENKELAAVKIQGVSALKEMEKITAGFIKLIRENRRLQGENKQLIAYVKRLTVNNEQLIKTNNRLASVFLAEFAHSKGVLQRCEALERKKTNSLRRLRRRAERKLEGRMSWWDWTGGFLSAMLVKGAFVLTMIYLTSRGP